MPTSFLLVAAAFALVLLTFGVGLRLLFVRSQEMREKRVHPQAAATSLRTLLASLLWVASTAFATTPLFDRIEVEGQRGNLHQMGRGWLDLPHSEKLQEFRREERCSAIGGPRGEYVVKDGKLWLYRLYRCGGTIELNKVYSQQDQPILATWVTGELVAEVGKSICMSTKGSFFIYETQIKIQVEEGAIKFMQSKSNVGHPDCPR